MSSSNRAEKFVMVPHEIYKQLYGGAEGIDGSSTTTTLSIRDAILNSKNIPGNTKTKLLAAADRAPTIGASEGVDEQMAVGQVKHNGVLEDTVASSTTGGEGEEEQTPTAHTTTTGEETGLTPSRAKIFQLLDTRITYPIRKEKAQQIFDILIKNRRITIDPHTLSFIVDGSQFNTVDAVTFLYDLQTYNKKIPKSYENLLTVSNIPQNLIVNKYAKQTTDTTTTTAADTTATPRRGRPTIFHSTPLSRDVFESFVSAQEASPFSGEEEVEDIDFSPSTSRMQRGVFDEARRQEEQGEGDWRYTF